MTAADGWSGTINGAPTVGSVARRSKLLSTRDIALYTEITGDKNPLHYDEEAAQRSQFGGLIVQGGVTSGMLNALVAESLPGPGTVFLSLNLTFTKAAYVGDTITAIVQVAKVRTDKPICTLAVEVQNSKGEVCLKGEAATYTASLR